jgi:hypothetical protein
MTVDESLMVYFIMLDLIQKINKMLSEIVSTFNLLLM